MGPLPEVSPRIDGPRIIVRGDGVVLMMRECDELMMGCSNAALLR
jgi:hypothetical protein